MRLRRCELHLCGSDFGTVLGSYECAKEILGVLQGRKFLD